MNEPRHDRGRSRIARVELDLDELLEFARGDGGRQLIEIVTDQAEVLVNDLAWKTHFDVIAGYRLLESLLEQYSQLSPAHLDGCVIDPHVGVSAPQLLREIDAHHVRAIAAVFDPEYTGLLAIDRNGLIAQIQCRLDVVVNQLQVIGLAREVLVADGVDLLTAPTVDVHAYDDIARSVDGYVGNRHRVTQKIADIAGTIGVLAELNPVTGAGRHYELCEVVHINRQF